jgi:hypothetical protein
MCAAAKTIGRIKNGNKRWKEIEKRHTISVNCGLDIVLKLILYRRDSMRLRRINEYVFVPW